MNDELTCDQVTDLSAELALGMAAGRERAAALRHLASCATCRGTVAGYALVADDVLQLAPAHEPPTGFAERTLARLEVAQAPRRGRPRRWLAPVAVAASIVFAAAFGAGAVLHTTAQERALGASYRDLLIGGNGSFFTVAPVTGPDGQVGTAWGYQGRPSWVFVSVPTIGRLGRFDGSVVTTDGRVIRLGRWSLDEGGAWGGAIPVSLSSIRELRLQRGDRTFVARFDPRSPWN